MLAAALCPVCSAAESSQPVTTKSLDPAVHFRSMHTTNAIYAPPAGWAGESTSRSVHFVDRIAAGTPNSPQPCLQHCMLSSSIELQALYVYMRSHLRTPLCGQPGVWYVYS